MTLQEQLAQAVAAERKADADCDKAVADWHRADAARDKADADWRKAVDEINRIENLIEEGESK